MAEELFRWDAHGNKKRMPWSVKVLSRLNEQRDKTMFCDMIVTVDGHEFNAHKCMLAACSPYFESLFRSNLMEARTGKVDLQCTSVEGMQSILNYMYTGEIELSMDTVEDIISGADHLLLTRLKRICEKFIVQGTASSYRCLRALQLVEAYNLEKWVSNMANMVLARRFSEVLQDKQCQPLIMELSADRLCDVLSHDKMTVKKEEDLFEFIVKWTNHAPTERAQQFTKLLSKLHLIDVDKSYLIDCIQEEPLVQQSMESRKYFTEALRYHLLPNRVDVKGKLKPQLKPRTTRLMDIIICVDKLGGCLYSYVLEENEWMSCGTSSRTEQTPCYAGVKLGNLLLCAKQRRTCGGEKNMYDPLSNSFIDGAGTKHEYGQGSAVVSNGKIYTFGGGPHCQSVEMFDPDNNGWIEKPSIPREPGYILHTAATKDGHIYVICYENNRFLTVWCLDRDDMWTCVLEYRGIEIKEVQPTSCIQPCISIESLNGIEVELPGKQKVVISNDPNHEVCIKDSTMPQIPFPRINAGICNVNGDIYVCGGLAKREHYTKFGDTNSVCMFNSSKQIWKNLPSMPRRAEIVGCALFQSPHEVYSP
ncbi:kelch-like protein 3 [Saccoglossus kowalevskii]|uniref:Kelch-like protein 2-like n=1 Tax=Saccoglossus kowalevskii TaxID=10224 RepID=A0ABM0GXK6_SACKO|nr:PREDICTED: kelch-like protein 2-like [Saccoglossus kowalevskii]